MCKCPSYGGIHLTIVRLIEFFLWETLFHCETHIFQFLHICAKTKRAFPQKVRSKAFPNICEFRTFQLRPGRVFHSLKPKGTFLILLIFLFWPIHSYLITVILTTMNPKRGHQVDDTSPSSARSVRPDFERRTFWATHVCGRELKPSCRL